MSFKNSLKEINLYTIMRINVPVLKSELTAIMRTEKVSTKQDLCIKTFRKVYPNLIF